MGKRPNLSREQRGRIAELREKRWTEEAIAAEIGCSIGSVSWTLLIDGIDINADKPLAPIPVETVVIQRGRHQVRLFTQAEDDRLIALEASGISLYKVGLALGRRRNSVVGRLATLARRDARAEVQHGHL